MAVPPGEVTVIFPVEPLPTTTVIRVEELTVKLETAVPPMVTALTPLKLAQLPQ